MFSTGIIIGAKFYFNFTDPLNFDQVYPNLLKELGDKGKAVSLNRIKNVFLIGFMIRCILSVLYI